LPDDAEIRELRNRVFQLEQRVNALEGQRQPHSEPPSEELESRFGLTVINRVGAVTVAIGIILFFKFAADNNWIGATGGLIVGLLAGMLLIAAAEWLRWRNQEVFAQGVAGCGLAILYIVFYAAHAYYHLIGLPLSFAGLAATCVLSFVLALRFEHAFLVPWNAIVFMAADTALLSDPHPWAFTYVALALAIAHFALSRRASKAFYFTGHACLLVAALRALDLWALPYTSPLDRSSVLSEVYSVFLAVCSLAMILAGIWRKSSRDRLLGLLLLSLVVAKLYLYDVWLLNHIYRISAFVALGLLLLTASYIYSRLKDKVSALLRRNGDSQIRQP